MDNQNLGMNQLNPHGQMNQFEILDSQKQFKNQAAQEMNFKLEEIKANNIKQGFLCRMLVNILFGALGILGGLIISAGCYLTIYVNLIASGCILILVPFFTNLYQEVYSKMLFSVAILIELYQLVVMCNLAKNQMRVDWSDDNFYTNYCTIVKDDGSTTKNKIAPGFILIVLYQQIIGLVINLVIHLQYLGSQFTFFYYLEKWYIVQAKKIFHPRNPPIGYESFN